MIYYFQMHDSLTYCSIARNHNWFIYKAEKSHKGRKLIPFVEGFWWVEIGSKDDIIEEFDEARHKLMGYAYGAWDHIKYSGHFPETENFALDWVGSLPGKRESRRFIGDFILSEPDQLGYRNFPDAVAYGGWSLDEHNPGGIENLKEPPSYFHEKFDEVYQIPYRCLYSKNISNLLFAGRNVSQTLTIQGRVEGKWVDLGTNDNNQRRLIKFNFDPIKTSAIRIQIKALSEISQLIH